MAEKITNNKTVNWYSELGALIDSFRKSWFPQVLQASLQKLFTYDYFLLAINTKNQPIKIIRSDFQNEKIRQALKYFQISTYKADPTWRLHNANMLTTGIYAMHELENRARKCSPIEYSKIKYLVRDKEELQGFRTKGWPDHLHELCIIIEIDDKHLCCISLYNTMLDTTDDCENYEQQANAIRAVFPALSALIRAFFLAPPGRKYIKEHEAGELSRDNFDTNLLAKFFTRFYNVELTKRELDIFVRLLSGLSLAAIADELYISLHTAKTHRRNVYRKTGQGNIMRLMQEYMSYKSESLNNGN